MRGHPQRKKARGRALCYISVTDALPCVCNRDAAADPLPCSLRCAVLQRKRLRDYSKQTQVDLL